MLFRCDECDWRGDEGDIVCFKDPEREGNFWNICPQCRVAEHFTNMCDEPGCNQSAGCGWPSAEGYRRTCYEHWAK